MRKNNAINNRSQLHHKQPSLGEIYDIMRESRTLHDQEIAKTFARWFGDKEKPFGHHHIDGHHQPA